MAKKEKEVLENEAELIDADHAEKRVYELGFHIDGELPAEDAAQVYKHVREQIAKAGEVVAEGEPQKVQLAYVVSRMETAGRRDFSASFFAWIAYETDGEGHQAVQEAVRAEKSVFRFLDIRTDKDAARHAAEMHEIMLKAAEKAGADEGQDEEVSDSEIDAALKEVGV
ncbi:MAG: hypothetical protein ABA06_02380 [Parcubacteria bacterium C7867-001]|nr:MAG: hypothetical protein ABA06_02380 [Parcubacteria bacterium C7867-001]